MNNDSIEFFAKASRNRIAYVTKIVEGMSHLAIISTVDRQQGTLRVICDGQAAPQVKKILQDLDCEILL